VRPEGYVNEEFSDAMWRYTWRETWVNCAVLTSNNAGLRTVLSCRLSHRQLRSSFREPHSFLSLPADTTMASSQGIDKNWQKTNKPDGETCALPENIQFSFTCSFFLHSRTAQFNLRVYEALLNSSSLTSKSCCRHRNAYVTPKYEVQVCFT
jgi:hypothetical protein